MSKILCFGDLHLTKEPIRLLTVMNFLDYVKEYCLKKDIKYIVNLGDFFNTPELKSNAFVPVFRKMLELSKIATIYSIVGNHECKNKGNDDTLVETFSSFGHFIQNSETMVGGHILPVTYVSNGLLSNLQYALITGIDSTYCNGKKCYVIKGNSYERYIDKETGLAVRNIEKSNKEITRKNDAVVDYEYKFNIVKDSDIVKPDTTGYIVNE